MTTQQKKRIVLGPLAVVLVAGAAGIGAWLWGRRVPPPTADAVTLAKFVASDRFNDLSPEEQRRYRDALRGRIPSLIDAADSGKLSDAEHLRAARRVMGDPMQKMAEDYFARSPGAELERFLDQVIDEQEKLLRQAPPLPPPGADKGPQMKPFPGGAALEELAAAHSPEDQARSAEFMGALRRRRQQRGLPGQGDGVFLIVPPPPR